VAGGLAFVSGRLGIVELGDVCALMRARNLELFGQLGSWVATTPDGGLQRLFAEACHRHAWHAELWQRRAPAIKVGEHPATPAPPAPDADGDDGAERRDHYRQAIIAMRDDLDELRSRVDATLDPSSRRTIDLVTDDLGDLLERLDALGVG
jgi:hypothetical protein